MVLSVGKHRFQSIYSANMVGTVQLIASYPRMCHEKRVSDLVEAIKKSDLTSSELKELGSFKLISRNKWEIKKRTWICSFLVLFIATWIIYNQLYTKTGFSRYWLTWEGLSVENEPVSIHLIC